jgi:hypothetical protein
MPRSRINAVVLVIRWWHALAVAVKARLGSLRVHAVLADVGVFYFVSGGGW